LFYLVEGSSEETQGKDKRREEKMKERFTRWIMWKKKKRWKSRKRKSRMKKKKDKSDLFSTDKRS
jgi:hypothetical protein